MYLSETYQKKWQPVLDHPDLPKVTDSYKRAVTSVILENQERALKEDAAFLSEAAPTNATGSNIANWDPILISLVRRAMPNLIAYDIAGVQPMSGPTGLIFAMRSRYKAQDGTEALFDEAESQFSLGRSTEITRDELKFTKFVQRLRKKFTVLFHDLLRTQLVLTGVIAEEEWDVMKEHIAYDWMQDGHFAELRDAEILRERLDMLGTVEPYLGNFFSKRWIQKNVLRQSDEEIDLMTKEIEDEGGGEDDDMMMSHKPEGEKQITEMKVVKK